MKFFRIILLLVPAYIVFQLFYSGFFFLKSRNLIENPHTGDFILGKGPEYLMLVAGDSVGAGVGASSFETSVVGRVATYLSRNRTVKLSNKSVSGYRMPDLMSVTLPSRKQNLILLIIGSNNLFHFTDINRFRIDTGKVLSLYSPKTDKLILVGPGRVFDADAIPLPLKPVYKTLGNNYAKIMAEEASKYKNVVYVNPLSANPPDKNYGFTGATDHFHPNDEGHRFWFDLIKGSL